MNSKFIEMFERDEKMIAEHGWVMHAVPATCYDGIHANYHTHGLEVSCGHTDLQIVLPINPRTAHAILNDIIDDIKAGKKYESGKQYDDVIIGFDVLMVKFIEGGRDVLRIIFPDPIGLFPNDEFCLSDYKAQIDDYDFN